MELKKIFKKDIARPINGVVKADQTENETVFVELDEYVITNELMKHIEKFFEFYMPSVYDPEKAAVAGKSGIWVSGFFGSGKSHFIKILSYLFKNIEATNGFSSRTAFDFFSEKLQDEPMLVGSIEQAIQKQNKVILFNIDSRADTDDREDAILKVFLKVFNEEMGYSGDHAHIAHLERDLDSRGLFESFQTEFEEITGVNWKEQRDSFDFYRDFIAEALAKVTNQSLDSTRQWVEKLEENFPLDIANFCKWVKEYLDEDQSRRLLFFVDEVGQYIGNNTQMMLKLQTITENLGTICGGRAWVIVTSQEDIDAVLGQMQGSKGQDFSKIQGRFQRISLSSSNTNEVIEKRLLEKNDDAKSSLAALYEDKGDIIRSQLSFEQTNSAELKNYTDTEEFVNSYPFIPYQYNLVQKIFTGISRAGASGQHMSKGERSLIDAFQIASNLYSEDSIGRLVPVYSFYNSIKKFLDTAVVRDINQASEKASISDFAISVLQTLFMIRYVDEIKSTLDNLVTLCINEVDQDKRELRLNIEAGLEALERNNLVARQGDEYIFLTNEEKEIEKEIQNTELELSEETAELSAIIFNEVLRRTEKYTYPENKQNFPIAYFCNGMPFGGKVESDIIFKVVSPIDNDYESYNDTTCVNYSADNVLVKLEDNQRLFDELRKYIKTQKYLKKGKSNGKEQEQLRHQKAQENQEARRRLVDEIEVLMKQADYYALGNTYDAKGSSPVKMLEGACHYVVTNTFQHLKMVKPFAGSNIRIEIQQTLVAGQSGQVDIDLGDAEINPLAVAEIEKHIAISDEHGYPVIAAELIKKFTKRPYGWNTDEIRLMLARLGAAGKITFQANQQDIELKHLFDHLDKTQRLANLRIRRIKQQSEANLKKAGKLYRDLNFGTAPSTEPELFVAATEKLTNWLDKLKGFQSKAETGNYPGVTEIQDGIILIGSLVEANSSYQFIESFLANDDELCDFEEEYESVENFYEQQFSVWQQLAHSLDIKFATNASFLEKDEEAKQALDKLAAIYANPHPYREIRNVKPLIEKVDAINNELMDKQRKFVTGKLQNQITDVQGIIADAGAPAEISNQALLPFQDAIKRIETARSVADIKNELSEADDWFNQAETLRNNYIRRQQELKRRAEEEAKKKAEAATKPVESQGSLLGAGNTDTAYKPKPATEAPQVQEAAVKAKPTKSVDAMEVYKGLSTSMYMESVEDVDNYLNALREKLVSLVESDHKVRIK